MARRPRIHFPGAFYHVMARGNRLQKIFLDDADYRRYLDFLREYKFRYRVLLYAYILMPEHLHLLLEVARAPLSRLMQSLQFRYTRNFNVKYRKSGHLFQNRYRAILCEKDAYFLELSAYIHLNSVRAGLVSDPAAYPWSSYSSYIREGNAHRLADVTPLLRQLAGEQALAREKYEAFVMSRISQGHREDFYRVKGQRFLGSDEFVAHIEGSLNSGISDIYDITLPEIVSKVSSIWRIPTPLFYSTSRNRQGAWGRSIAGYLARKLGGCRVRTVGEHFERDPAVISQGIKGVEVRLFEDSDFALSMAALENELVSGRGKVVIR